MTFRYRSKDALLKTTVLKIELTEGMVDYITQVALRGLHGNTLEAAAVEMIRRELWREVKAGRVMLKRYPLRGEA